MTTAWRSLLFVPADRPRYVQKACASGADAVLLDLEDGVAASAKEAARAALADAVGQLRAAGLDVAVRINRPWRLAVCDFEAAVLPGVRAVVLPKVPSGEHVRACAEVVGELETERGLEPGSVALIALIESPSAVERAAGIAGASDRLVALTLGVEDYAAAIGVPPSRDLLLGPASRLVNAARAAGLQAFGAAGSVASYRDLTALADELALARRLGFTASYAIHPDQVETINAAFTPTEAEVERAQAVVDAYRAALDTGRGAVAVGGAMVDEPVYRQAVTTLLRAGS